MSFVVWSFQAVVVTSAVAYDTREEEAVVNLWTTWMRETRIKHDELCGAMFTIVVS